MGRTAHGVRGIKLLADDYLVGMIVAHDPDGTVFTACENGYGKRTPLDDYPIKNRGGQGVINIRTSARNGAVISLRLCSSGDDLMLITESGMIMRSPIVDMRPMGRGTQGVRVVNLKADDRLVATEVVRAEDIAIEVESDPTLMQAEPLELNGEAAAETPSAESDLEDGDSGAPDPQDEEQ